MPVLVLSSGYSCGVSLKPAIRQNSLTLYIIKKVERKIRGDTDRILYGGILSKYKGIYRNAFFIMTVYREKESLLIV